MARQSAPPVTTSAFAATAAVAPPPAPVTDDGSRRGDREGSVRSISIHADGSAHGGRRYFDGQADGQQRRDHLAVWMVEDGGSTRGGATAPSQQQQQREGSVKAGVAATEGSLPCSCCGCTCQGGGGGGSGPIANGGTGRRKGDFGQAKVLIEEADERKLFDWGTYFSSLPKKLKGASRASQGRGAAAGQSHWCRRRRSSAPWPGLVWGVHGGSRGARPKRRSTAWR